MRCHCPECWGLREVMLEMTGKEYGLKPAPGHAPQLAVVGSQHVDGSMTCACQACVAERALLLAVRLVRPDPKQPWDIKRAA